MRVLATMTLLVLALGGGCGGDDDGEDGLARPAPTTEAEPPPAPAQPEVPGAERARAIAVVSRYADALEAGRFERACASVAGGGAACEAAVERFVRRSKVVRLTRTVPVWDSGAIDSGTGALRARVKIGFPARPATPWTFRLVKEPGEPWRLATAVPAEGR